MKVNPGPILLQAEGLIGTNDETDAMGFYAMGAYRLTPCLQLVGKVDFFDPDTDTDADDDSITLIRGGVNCFIAGDNQLQLFYQLSSLPNDKTEHNIIAQLAMIFNTE